MAAPEVDVRLLGLDPEDLAEQPEGWEQKAAKAKQPGAKQPTPTSSDGDFLGLDAIGQSLWTVFELPSQILGCSSTPNAGGKKGDKEPKYYDASSVDWADIFCPSSSPEKRISQFDANVVFAYLKTTQPQLVQSGTASKRNIQCYNTGRINTLDFENNDGLGPKELIESLSGLQELVCLRLHNENLCGPIPLTLFAAKLVHLEVLDLSRNNLEGQLDATAPLEQLSKLEVLNLSHNKLSGGLPECLGKLAALESLILNDNGFAGALPASLKNLSKLKYVDLQRNRFLPGLSSADAKSTVQALLPEAAELFI